MSQLTRRLSQFDDLVSITPNEKNATRSIQFLIYVSWCLLRSINTWNSYMQCKKKSPIWQSFKILLMPDRCLFLLNSSRFVSIKINQFRLSKTFNSRVACFVVRSWIQLPYPPSRNLQFMTLEDHLKGAKCFLLRTILYYFYFLTKNRQ